MGAKDILLRKGKKREPGRQTPCRPHKNILRKNKEALDDPTDDEGDDNDDTMSSSNTTTIPTPMPNNIICTVSPSPRQTSNGVVYVFQKCPHCGLMKHPKGIPAHQKKCKELQEEAKNSHDGKVGCKFCEERFHPSEVTKHLPYCKIRQQKKPSREKATTLSSTVEEKTTSPKPPTSKGTTTMVASVVEAPFIDTLAEHKVVTNNTNNDSATAGSPHSQDLPKRTTCSSLLVSDHKRSIEKISHSNNKNDNGDRDYNN